MDKYYYVYIMSNWDNKVIYIGVTNDLMRRITEHKEKKIEGFTKKYNLTKLVYYEYTTDVNSAIVREKYLKGKSRKFKEKLINDFNIGWEDLYNKIIC